MKTVFYTIVSDQYYYPIGTPKFVNSFKYFHPDIDLVVFRQDVIDTLFKVKPWLNFYNCKPSFAKLLTDSYDLVVNIDADTVILGRLEAVLKGDYDFGAAWNYNDYENRSVEDVTEEQFLQAGLVGSTSKVFWDVWEAENKKRAMNYVCKENDVLSLIAYHELKDLKLKIFDKELDYMGCKSLGREGEFYVQNGNVMCRGQRVLAYHHAKGAGALPKLQYSKMGFPEEVVKFMDRVSNYGVTFKTCNV